MYQLIEKDGSVFDEVANFNAARAWAEEKGGRSVYDEFATGGPAIIYTYTANSTVFPDFQVGTFKPDASTKAQDVPVIDIGTEEMRDGVLSRWDGTAWNPVTGLTKDPNDLPGAGVTGFPANPTMGQTVVIDGSTWTFGDDGWVVAGGGGTGTEWTIDPASGLSLNPDMEGLLITKPDGSQWQMTKGKWNSVKADTVGGGVGGQRDDEGFPINPVVGQTVDIDGKSWTFGDDGQWVPVIDKLLPSGLPIEGTGKWPIDPISGLSLNPVWNGATTTKADGSKWKMTGGEWNLVKSTTTTGLGGQGGQVGTYAGINFTDPDFIQDWAEQLVLGDADVTTEYLDGLLKQWALANNQNPSGAYNALFSATDDDGKPLGSKIVDHPKWGTWASKARDSFAPDEMTLSQSQVLDSLTRGGRRQLFNRYRATQGLGGKTQRALDLFNMKFDPSSARFALDNILNWQFTTPNLEENEVPFSAMNPGAIPESRLDTNFRSFLADPNAAPPLDPAGFQERFSRIEPWFNTPDEEMSASDLARREALSGPNVDDAMVFNIIKQALSSEVNPFLRSGIGDILARRVAAFRDVDTETPLFEEFVNRGFKF